MQSILTKEWVSKYIDYDSETVIARRKFETRYNKYNSEIISKDAAGRIVVYVEGKQYKLHRLIWILVHGYIPQQIDHINGLNYDNRLVNLRDVNGKINQQNRRRPNKNNSTGFLGVSKKRNKFSVQIRIDGKIKRLGCYTTKEEAYSVYLKNKRIYHSGCTL